MQPTLKQLMDWQLEYLLTLLDFGAPDWKFRNEFTIYCELSQDLDWEAIDNE